MTSDQEYLLQKLDNAFATLMDWWIVRTCDARHFLEVLIETACPNLFAKRVPARDHGAEL